MTLFPTREEVDELREQYPVGCRVRLVYMDDVHAPDEGTLGKATRIDGIGTIHVKWDTGSALGVAWEADRCERV